MAEINVPAPKPSMIPMARLLNENRVAIIPPSTREEVANNPHKNAFSISENLNHKNFHHIGMPNPMKNPLVPMEVKAYSKRSTIS